MAEEKQCVLVLIGANRMPEIIEGIAFKDGIKQLNHAA